MRKKVTFVSTAMLMAALATSPLMAQRGGGAGGAGRGGSMGGGMGASMGRGSSQTHGGPGMDQGRPMPGMEPGTHTTMDRQKTAGELLTQNTKLASKLGTLLPPGTDLQQAAGGFKNLGEFVSAVHVSQNLDIPFEDLKARTTGPDAVSLGKAIKELKPDVDAKAEAKKAKKQAENDLREQKQ